MQNVLLEGVSHPVSEHTEQVGNLTKGLIDFFPLDFHLLGAAESKTADCADLIDSGNAEEFIDEGCLVKALEFLLD